jgi:hypothetical protein
MPVLQWLIPHRSGRCGRRYELSRVRDGLVGVLWAHCDQLLVITLLAEFKRPVICSDAPGTDRTKRRAKALMAPLCLEVPFSRLRRSAITA